MPSSRRRLAALAAAAVVALPAFTRAASYTWDGSVGGNWFDTLTVNSTVVDTNWTSTFDGGLPLLTSFPSLGDDAIVNSPTANISLTKNNGVNTLSLVSGSNLTVSGNGSGLQGCGGAERRDDRQQWHRLQRSGATTAAS